MLNVKRISLLNVLVKNQDSAIEFYTQKLGFVVAEDVPFGPKRWVTIKLPDNPGLSIALNLADSDGDLALVGKQAGSQPLFSIEIDDCLAEYRRMKEAGVKFHGEPQVEPYGTGVTFEDPYGNKIYMNQEPH
jgi:predicted enzyme related to lactoylglutathione lyase